MGSARYALRPATYDLHRYYLIDDVVVTSSPPIHDNEMARVIARAGIVRHKAHRARILNAVGLEVELMSRET